MSEPCEDFYCVLKNSCYVGHECANGTDFECPNRICEMCANQGTELCETEAAPNE